MYPRENPTTSAGVLVQVCRFSDVFMLSCWVSHLLSWTRVLTLSLWTFHSWAFGWALSETGLFWQIPRGSKMSYTHLLIMCDVRSSHTSSSALLLWSSECGKAPWNNYKKREAGKPVEFLMGFLCVQLSSFRISSQTNEFEKPRQFRVILKLWDRFDFTR